jgi:hypothetical protein
VAKLQENTDNNGKKFQQNTKTQLYGVLTKRCPKFKDNFEGKSRIQIRILPPIYIRYFYWSLLYIVGSTLLGPRYIQDVLGMYIQCILGMHT